MKSKLLNRILLSSSLGLIGVGCANTQFGTLGSSILSSTGLVSSSQADALFKAGSKIASAAGPLTNEQEYYLGRSVAAMVLTQYPLYKNSAVNNYVNTVGNAVAAFSDRPETFGGYHFAVIDSSEINALSAPGGFVFVSKGFLSVIPNEDSLAAVLAHEVAHIVKGHGVKAISQANLTEAVSILGKEAATSYGGSSVREITSAFGGSVTEVFDTLLKSGYSRSQEYEADEYAAELLKRAGYSPSALVDMLKILQASAAKHKGSGWYNTHPAPEKRIDELGSSVKSAVANAGSVKIRTIRFKSSVKGEPAAVEQPAAAQPPARPTAGVY